MIVKTPLKALMVLMVLGLLALSSCTDKKAQKPIDLRNMDLSVLPGDDFYRFANGGWLLNNPIPEEYSRYGSFEQLAEQNEDKLFALLNTIRKDKKAQPGSNRQRIRDFYNSAMDSLSQDQLGIEPVAPLLEMVESIANKQQLAEVFAYFHQRGISPVFGLGAAQDRMNTEIMIASIGQGGMGMSDRDYYLNNDNRSLEIRENYELLIEKLFVLAGYSKEQARQARLSIMEIETRLADASMTRLERRNPYATYNKMSLEALQQLTPNFNWNLYLDGRGVDILDLNVSQPRFLNR